MHIRRDRNSEYPRIFELQISCKLCPEHGAAARMHALRVLDTNFKNFNFGRTD